MIRHIGDASIQLTDRFAHSSDETRLEETAESLTAITDRIDDRNYDLSFTAGDARRFARVPSASNETLSSLPQLTSATGTRIVIPRQGVRMRLSRQIHTYPHCTAHINPSPPEKIDRSCRRIWTPEDSLPASCLRANIRARGSRIAREDRRPKILSSNARIIIQRAAHRRDERDEKGGRRKGRGSEENGR